MNRHAKFYKLIVPRFELAAVRISQSGFGLLGQQLVLLPDSLIVLGQRPQVTWGNRHNAPVQEAAALARLAANDPDLLHRKDKYVQVAQVSCYGFALVIDVKLFG